MSQNTQNTVQVGPSTFDFQAQFTRCQQWNDADQWDALGMLYYQAGYGLNALHCFERADACRVGLETVAVETEVA